MRRLVGITVGLLAGLAPYPGTMTTWGSAGSELDLQPDDGSFDRSERRGDLLDRQLPAECGGHLHNGGQPKAMIYVLD